MDETGKSEISGSKAHIEFNVSVLRGEGALGAEFLEVRRASPIYGAVQYIEALIDSHSGRLVEFLYPDCTRVYEKAVAQGDGFVVTVPVPLSNKNPKAHHLILLTDPFSGEIQSVVQRVIMEAWAIDDLRRAIDKVNSYSSRLAA
jgi:hypothetical protein